MSNAEAELKILLENPVLIYGAGSMGRRAAVALKELGTDVLGIAVTSMCSNVDMLCGYTVKEIERWRDCAKKAVVLIASFNYQKDMIQTCKACGFENIIAMDFGIDSVFCSVYIKSILTSHDVDLRGEFIQMGGGYYMNPFTQLEKDAAQYIYIEELEEFILPPLFDEWEDVREGTYELGEVMVSSGDVVFDLGAHYGVFSVYAASKGAKSYAFEPTTQLGKNIERLSELNNGEIHLVPYAVSNVCEKTQFYVSDYTCGNSLIKRECHFGAGENSSTIMVDQITIDEFVKRNNIPSVDFIKADIEGAERLMLEGAQETLEEFAPKLALCTYHLPDDKEVMTELILKANPDYKIEYKWKKLYAHI